MTTAKKPSSADKTEFYQPTSASLDQANNLGQLVKQVYGSITRMIDHGVAPLDLTAQQWRPLALMRYANVNTPAELARRVNLDTGAMTRTLDRLEAKGFLKRHRCEDDRRVVKLDLTESGHEAVNGILPAVSHTLNTHLDGFSQAEFEQLLHFLHRLIDNGAASE